MDCQKHVLYFSFDYQYLMKTIKLSTADASKSGVAQETLQNVARRSSKVMTEEEARKILGVTGDTAWEEVLKASSTPCTIVINLIGF